MDEERTLSQRIPDNLLRVLVIVKRPLLALRYGLLGGQIRKIQMNFVQSSGCDTALEHFKAAGLPIRDKDLPEVQTQHPPSSPSQPPHQERSGSIERSHAPGQQSSQDAFPGSSQRLSQETTTSFWNASHASLTPSAQQSRLIDGTKSGPGGANQDGLSKVQSRSTLSALGSAVTVSSMPTMAKLHKQSGLLQSPVFNGTYEPFGCFPIRSPSSPDHAQTQQDDNNALPQSQMLPPERTLAFSRKTSPFRREEAASQEGQGQQEPVTTKTKAKRQKKPRAQPVKSRKSRAKVEITKIPSDSIAPSSPSPATLLQAKAPLSGGPPMAASSTEQPAVPSNNSRKRSLNDQSMNQPKKRHAQTVAQTAETVIETLSKTAATEQPVQVQPSQSIDTHVNTSSRQLLESIDNLMARYRDLPAPKAASQTSEDYLAQYAVQSEVDTVKVLDELVRTCMNDDKFEKLMEDIEADWKRIGLGSRETDQNGRG